MTPARPGRPAVFLDRDGTVLGDVGAPPRHLALQQDIVAAAPRLCADLKSLGYALVLVTNQPDIARGAVTADQVRATNEMLREALVLDAVFVCPHDDRDGCGCRKPLPGMLVAAASVLDLDLSRSLMVGDRLTDVAAGAAAGSRTAFITRGPEAGHLADFVGTSLGDVIQRFLAAAGIAR